MRLVVVSAMARLDAAATAKIALPYFPVGKACGECESRGGYRRD